MEDLKQYAKEVSRRRAKLEREWRERELAKQRQGTAAERAQAFAERMAVDFDARLQALMGAGLLWSGTAKAEVATERSRDVVSCVKPVVSLTLMARPSSGYGSGDALQVDPRVARELSGIRRLWGAARLAWAGRFGSERRYFEIRWRQISPKLVELDEQVGRLSRGGMGQRMGDDKPPQGPPGLEAFEQAREIESVARAAPASKRGPSRI